MTEPQDYQAPDYPRIRAEGMAGRDGKGYVPHPDLVAAANAALALEMPLLLTGEAGCGKTDFGYAVAAALAGDPAADPRCAELLECYVRSDSVARDLLYHYDAIRRFGDAQHGGEADRGRAEEVRNYVQLKDLGRALMSPRLRVVLVDEIDKAPRDLPNDLLRELDQGKFEIPEIPVSDEAPAEPVDPDRPATYRQTMARPPGAPRPMVIITSNVERQLPDPFLRRCVFFHIPFPERQEELAPILAAHAPGLDAPLVGQALGAFTELRAVRALTKKPTTSELIAWVKALRDVFDRGHVQGALEAFSAGRGAAPGERGWGALPALGCLVKLREDLERLGVRAHTRV